MRVKVVKDGDIFKVSTEMPMGGYAYLAGPDGDDETFDTQGEATEVARILSSFPGI